MEVDGDEASLIHRHGSIHSAPAAVNTPTSEEVSTNELDDTIQRGARSHTHTEGCLATVVDPDLPLDGCLTSSSFSRSHTQDQSILPSQHFASLHAPKLLTSPSTDANTFKDEDTSPLLVTNPSVRPRYKLYLHFTYHRFSIRA